MTAKFRVALVSPYALDVPGGVQGQVSGLAVALERLGLCVEVIAPGLHANGSGINFSFDIVTVGRVLAVPVNGSRAPISPSPRAMRRSVRALDAFQPDVVHVHEPFVPGPSLATLLAHRRPTVATFHRSDAGRGYRALGPFFRLLMRRIDDVAAVSDAALATLQAVVGSAVRNSTIVENAVDIERFADAEPWPKSGPTVVFAGRHEPRKGLRTLLDAFRDVRVDASLWVIGEGAETSSLRARFANDSRIEWCGRLNDELLARRIRAADVFVAPSLRGESFGVVLSEAMAAGVAVIASDLPGYRLAGKDAVQYVAPGDSQALSERISSLLSDAQLRDHWVAAGRARAQELDFSLVATCYREHYERLSIAH